MNKRFDKFSDDRAILPKDAVIELSLKTTRAIRRERMDFMRDRLGHNGRGTPSRVTYMAHAKGYVMARHPGCIPFVISEKEWRSFPYWEPGVNT